jgi:hypothetical protein
VDLKNNTVGLSLHVYLDGGFVEVTANDQATYFASTTSNASFDFIWVIGGDEEVEIEEARVWEMEDLFA